MNTKITEVTFNHQLAGQQTILWRETEELKMLQQQQQQNSKPSPRRINQRGNSNELKHLSETALSWWSAEVMQATFPEEEVVQSWFFITYRKRPKESWVTLSGQALEWLPQKRGIPHGSVLDPIFFVSYLTDLELQPRHQFLCLQTMPKTVWWSERGNVPKEKEGRHGKLQNKVGKLWRRKVDN